MWLIHPCNNIISWIITMLCFQPSIESKLMGDIANLKALAKTFRESDALPLDYYTVFSELEKQLG